MSDVYTIPDHRRVVADMDVDTRAAFITRTYVHLFGAVVAFVVFEMALFSSGIADRILSVLAGSPMTWLLFLGGFMVVGWLATRTAHRAVSPTSQYLALAGFVAAEAVIFVPLIWYANTFAKGAIQSAAIITVLGFIGLTAVVFLTRKDFSFLRGILGFGFVAALLLIVGAAIFGFNLGLIFSVAMVALAAGAILYDTSNVLHHYPEDRHVAASLQLFASVALLFFYVLRIVIALQSD